MKAVYVYLDIVQFLLICSVDTGASSYKWCLIFSHLLKKTSFLLCATSQDEKTAFSPTLSMLGDDVCGGQVQPGWEWAMGDGWKSDWWRWTSPCNMEEATDKFKFSPALDCGPSLDKYVGQYESL